VIVVSNASPLIILARAGQLHLLAELYGAILIPAEVHAEVVVAGRGLPGSREVGEADWIKVKAVPPGSDPHIVDATAHLGDGERNAILLAKRIEADLLLLDECRARRIARSAGLSVVGCIGILEAAARMGDLPDLRATYVDLLRQSIRFDLELLQDSLARLGLPPL
jgi:predicted nucleic acid-binding protein